MLTTLFFVLELKLVLKLKVMRGEFNGFFILKKTNREALTMLCSVVKHLGSGYSTQEVGRNTRRSRVFLPTLCSCSNRFMRALQQSRAQSRVLYSLSKMFLWGVHFGKVIMI